MGLIATFLTFWTSIYFNPVQIFFCRYYIRIQQTRRVFLHFPKIAVATNFQNFEIFKNVGFQWISNLDRWTLFVNFQTKIFSECLGLELSLQNWQSNDFFPILKSKKQFDRRKNDWCYPEHWGISSENHYSQNFLRIILYWETCTSKKPISANFQFFHIKEKVKKLGKQWTWLMYSYMISAKTKKLSVCPE